MKKTLRALQNELIDLVVAKYEKDQEIQGLYQQILVKQEELVQKREARKERLGDKVNKVVAKISIATLEICGKLLHKEIKSNEYMGYEISIDLKVANNEINNMLEGCIYEETR